MKRLSINILIIFVLSIGLISTFTAYATEEDSTTATLGFSSVIHLAVGNNPSLDITQDMIAGNGHTTTDIPFSTDISVNVTSLTEYNLYSAYKVSSGGTISDLIDGSGDPDSLLSLNDGNNDIDINHVDFSITSNNFNENTSGADSVKQLNPDFSDGDLSYGVAPTGESTTTALEIDLTQIDQDQASGSGTGYTFEVGFFVEEI